MYLAAPANAAPSEPVGGGWFQIRARHSDKCLDVAWASTAHGADVVQGNCTPGNRNQQWRLVPLSGNFFRIVARHSGQCLDVAWASAAHGADVVQADCTPGNRNQHWSFVPTQGGLERRGDGSLVPAIGSNVRIVARHSGKCLDVAHGSIAHAANVLQGTCWSPGFNQQWRFVPAG
ncbi:RICIN domain-containing protein [Streptomyces virginiae]|uniref:RICIN domain-containing protein n=1 Tax=Streptomyces virginiae TaxID=1961 RepID=UPI00368B7519